MKGALSSVMYSSRYKEQVWIVMAPITSSYRPVYLSAVEVFELRDISHFSDKIYHLQPRVFPSLNQLIFLCAPESTEGIPQGSLSPYSLLAQLLIILLLVLSLWRGLTELLMYAPAPLISSYKQGKLQHHTCSLCFICTFVNFELNSVEHHFL